MSETGQSIMAGVLKAIRDNVIAGIRDAQKAGVACSMPKEIEINMPIDRDGIPCTSESEEAGRITTFIVVEQQ